ncbi:MAG: PhzF family phenazine biosynthesis protein [Candidatus Thorarchaeota archaeon]|jgi:trans-2,3-dihydro-3-hydroxyanthranilate isomerase
MRKIPYLQTSVFVDDRLSFGGNQLATYWDVDANVSLSQEEMQGMTLEMNFSESTFLERPTTEGCSFKVRIFTPAREIPFAGHPTLGTTFVLKRKGLIEQDQKTSLLELGVGPIHVKFIDDETIQMTQPTPSFKEIPENLSEIAAAVGLKVEDIVPDYPVQVVSTGFPFLIIPIKTISLVKRAFPVPSFGDKLKDLSTRQVLIFSTETEHSDSHVHARMFAPEVGVVEDPATGSAAGPLGAFLEKYQVLSNHKIGEPIFIEQGFELNRPSQLVARVPNDKLSEVLVSGKVRLIAEGSFHLP